MELTKKNKIFFFDFFIFSFLFLIVAFIYKDFNITDDEPLHRYYGESILNYYLTLGKNKSFHDLFNLKYYGPFFDLLVNSFYRIFSGFGIYESMHFINGIFSVIGIFYLYKIARYWFRDSFSYFIIPIVFFSPLYFNSSFNQPKDIPFASLFIVSIYYLIRYIQIAPRWNRKILILLSVSIGLSNSIRTLGVLLYLFGLIVFLYKVFKFKNKKNTIRKLSYQAGLIFFISFLVMIIFFPYLHKAPLRNYIETILIFSKFPYSINYLFMGEIVNSLNTPRSYIPVFLIVKSPEYLVLAIFLLFLLIFNTVFKKIKIHKKENKIFNLIFGSFGSLVIVLILLKPVLYNPRQILFLFPFFYLILLYAMRYFYINYKIGKIMIPTLLVSGILHSLVMLYLYHPSQASYFNILVSYPLKSNPYFDLNISNTQNSIKLIEKHIEIHGSKEKEYYIFDSEQQEWLTGLKVFGLDEKALEMYKQKIPFPLNLRTENKSYYLPSHIKLNSNVNNSDFVLREDFHSAKSVNLEAVIQEFRGDILFSIVYKVKKEILTYEK